MGTSEGQTSSPESSIGDEDNGELVVEDAAPSGTPSSMESDIRHLEVEATSAPLPTRTQAEETSRRESAGAPQDLSRRSERAVPPKDTLDDFFVPPAGTPYGEGFYTSSGSFTLVSDLDPMLDEIWSEEEFKRLSKEPLQAGNREGMRLLSRVKFTEAFSFEELTRSFLIVLFVAGFPCQLHLLLEV